MRVSNPSWPHSTLDGLGVARAHRLGTQPVGVVTGLADVVVVALVVNGELEQGKQSRHPLSFHR